MEPYYLTLREGAQLPRGYTWGTQCADSQRRWSGCWVVRDHKRSLLVRVASAADGAQAPTAETLDRAMDIAAIVAAGSGRSRGANLSDALEQLRRVHGEEAVNEARRRLGDRGITLG